MNHLNFNVHFRLLCREGH